MPKNVHLGVQLGVQLGTFLFGHSLEYYYTKRIY